MNRKKASKKRVLIIIRHAITEITHTPWVLNVIFASQTWSLIIYRVMEKKSPHGVHTHKILTLSAHSSDSYTIFSSAFGKSKLRHHSTSLTQVKLTWKLDFLPRRTLAVVALYIRHFLSRVCVPLRLYRTFSRPTRTHSEIIKPGVNWIEIFRSYRMNWDFSFFEFFKEVINIDHTRVTPMKLISWTNWKTYSILFGVRYAKFLRLKKYFYFKK